MKKLICISIALILCISCIFALVGCESNTVSNIVIANEQYTDKASLEKAKQRAELPKDKDVYASIYFVESPKGMKYTANWSYDGEVIKSEEKEMNKNQHGVIVYALEADKIKAGTLKLEIKYKDYVATESEITVK